MRILHLIHSADPSGGGPIEGVKQLGMKAESIGYTVEVLSLDSPQSPFLKSFPLPIHAIGPGFLNYGYAPALAAWLKQNATRYDLVVVNGIWQYHSYCCWRELRETAIPYVVFTHGMLDPWFKHHYPLKHIKKWLYWNLAEFYALRDAAAVIFTCQEEMHLASQSFSRYKVKGFVVNYGTADPAGSPEKDKKVFLEQFPSAQGKRLLLFMSRIHPKKGCDNLIRAFAAALAKDPSWQLVIAGPDQLGWRSNLEKLARRLNISHRITWTGLLTGDLKWGAFHAAEAFVLPSHQENFGIVIAEALSCALPVLISNRVNIWREVEEDGAGFVETDDLRGATLLLNRWAAASDEDVHRMRLSARKCFRSRFQIDRASSSLLQAFASILKTSDSVAAAL